MTKQALRLITIFLCTAVLLIGEVPASQEHGADDSAYLASLAKWRAERLEEVNGPEGWTTLAGLFWLDEGMNGIGSAPTNPILLPAHAPKFAGNVLLSRGVVTLKPNRYAGLLIDGKPAAEQILSSDVDGKPTAVTRDSLKFYIIKRGDKLGVRVKDKANSLRTNFKGIQQFSINQKLRVYAKFDPYNPQKTIPIMNVLNVTQDMISPGSLSFEIDGKTYKLDPVLEKGSDRLFIIFADQTTGKETYGAGRYLYADPPGPDGKVLLDFNRAENPSCAFTKFATCPLPPRQNRLTIRVEAGEKKYEGPGH